MQDLRYPIGEFSFSDAISSSQIEESIRDIEAAPEKLRAAVAGLNDEQLDTPYRPEGWTVRQVVHHMVDSHIGSYVRFKWALTEDTPMIKTYDEKTWAELKEARTGPIDMSLLILEALHTRLVVMLKNLSETDLQRSFIHPEFNRQIRLDQNISLYAWHGKHHAAHITELRKRKDW